MTKSDTATTAKPRTRRTAREATIQTKSPAGPVAPKTSKLDQVQTMLLEPAGASIGELVTATGWQQHSVRGAMAGALKKRGLVITSEKIDGTRRYRAEKPA